MLLSAIPLVLWLDLLFPCRVALLCKNLDPSTPEWLKPPRSTTVESDKLASSEKN